IAKRGHPVHLGTIGLGQLTFSRHCALITRAKRTTSTPKETPDPMVPPGSFVLIAVLTVLMMDEENGANARRVKRSAQTYTTKYDNIDIDQILASNRLLKNYVNCLLDKGGCTQEGKELKKYLPDAIATECSKCSQTQKKIAGRVFQALLLNHRDDWELLTNKYDPEGNFQKKYLQEDEDYSDLEEA
ncbi:hypothetical protein HUJ04_004556, partial [Dendroctonus ponderosae]